MALSVGTRLGSYEIGAQIGVGGMGEVYRALDTNLGRQVAIKILPDTFADDPERLARFEREAKTLATLNHTNIAQIYGFEKADGARALVMELVEGETLADRIARGPLPLDEALIVARQIADALETAHEQGIVHRDLKPANVKVRPDGTVKVLDFGLAKLADPASGSNVTATLSPTLSLNATMAGVILGTAAYMAPEQARGKPVDKRADIWAFGVVLYEMVTASQLFPGDDVSHVLARVIDREPDWSRLPPALPSSLRVCLQRCLVKDPRQRMRDIGDVRLALDGAFDTQASSLHHNVGAGSTPVPFWRRVVPAAALSLLLAGLSALAVWIILRPGPLPVTRFELTTPADGPLSFSSRPTLAIAADGRVAYASLGTLYLRGSGDIDPVPIRGTEARDLSTPFFSPDGTSIGFIEGFAQPYTLKRVPSLGGAPTTLAQMRFPTYGASWGSGNTMVLGTEEGLRRISANGGAVEPLTRVTEKGESHRWPSVLPDGRSVLFTVWLGSVEASQLAVASLETGNVTRLGLSGTSPRYSPTGHLVYAAGSSLRAVGFDADRLTTTNVNLVATVLENVHVGSSNGVAYFGIANSGTLVYFASPPVSGRLTLALVDTAGQAQPIGVPGTGYQYPRVARNGRWVVYQAEYTDGTDIAIFEIGGTTAPSRLTFGGKSRFPVWTADSRRIIFQSTRDGDAGLFWQLSDGTGTAEAFDDRRKG